MISLLGYIIKPTDALYNNHIKCEHNILYCGHSAYSKIVKICYAGGKFGSLINLRDQINKANKHSIEL